MCPTMKTGVNDRSYFGAAFTAVGARVSRSRTWSQTATLGIVDRGGGGLEGDCGDAAGVVLVVATGRGRPPGRALTKARDPAASCRQGEESRWVWPRLNSFDPCRTPRLREQYCRSSLWRRESSERNIAEHPVEAPCMVQNGLFTSTLIDQRGIRQRQDVCADR